MEDSVHVVLPKRPREETFQEVNSTEDPSKRHKPYTHILSLLESDEDDPTQQDLSPLITTLQQEISSSTSDSQSLLTPDPNPKSSTSSIFEDSINGGFKEEEEEEGVKYGVIRHLLEASDDELGIPNTGMTGDNIGVFDFGESGFNGGDYEGFYSVCDDLWEFEDETANYYTLLQSELFM